MYTSRLCISTGTFYFLFLMMMIACILQDCISTGMLFCSFFSWLSYVMYTSKTLYLNRHVLFLFSVLTALSLQEIPYRSVSSSPVKTQSSPQQACSTTWIMAGSWLELKARRASIPNSLRIPSNGKLCCWKSKRRCKWQNTMTHWQGKQEWFLGIVARQNTGWYKAKHFVQQYFIHPTRDSSILIGLWTENNWKPARINKLCVCVCLQYSVCVCGGEGYLCVCVWVCFGIVEVSSFELCGHQ